LVKGEARDRLVGIVLIVLSAGAFGAVDGISKILVQTASPAQIVWARYALAIPFLLLTTRPSALKDLARTNRPGLQIVRGLAPLLVSLGMVLGVQYLPLADATAILFAAPLLVVALSMPMLGEPVHRSHWWAVAVGFAAVLVVARPGLSALSQFAIFPLIAAVFYALLQLLTRRLSAAGERSRTTLAWTLVSGTIAATPFAIWLWRPLDAQTWILLFVLGGVFGVAQLTMIAGLARAPAALVAPLAYVQIIAAVAFGFIVFGEVPDVWTILGIIMIIGAGLYVLRHRAE
jgi:drug/metabolite transporter (DMT)-like permease